MNEENVMPMRRRQALRIVLDAMSEYDAMYPDNYLRRDIERLLGKHTWKDVCNASWRARVCGRRAEKDRFRYGEAYEGAKRVTAAAKAAIGGNWNSDWDDWRALTDTVVALDTDPDYGVQRRLYWAFPSPEGTEMRALWEAALVR